MNSHTGQQRRFPALAIAVVLFILCINPGQAWISKLIPSISGLAQINPSLIFWDIPIKSPMAIDLILAPGLFLVIYTIVIMIYPLRPGIFYLGQSLQRVRSAFTGLFVLLCSMLIGGWIYYMLQDHLSLQARNGINTLGINADVHLAYPGYETINLRGSMILLICFLIGLIVFIRKISKVPKEGLTREQRMTPYERMLQEKRMKKEESKTYNNWKPVAIEQKAMQPAYNSQSRVCLNQPVLSLKPLAVGYMPMG